MVMLEYRPPGACPGGSKVRVVPRSPRVSSILGHCAIKEMIQPDRIYLHAISVVAMMSMVAG